MLILALPLLPKNRIYEAYQEIVVLIKNIYPAENVSELLNYVEYTYIGVKTEGIALKEPFYNIHEWSVYDSVKKSYPRTNNTVEAWHRGFNASIQIKRPNIAYLINKLLVSEETDKYNILQSKRGANLWEDQNYRKKIFN